MWVFYNFHTSSAVVATNTNASRSPRLRIGAASLHAPRLRIAANYAWCSNDADGNGSLPKKIGAVRGAGLAPMQNLPWRAG